MKLIELTKVCTQCGIRKNWKKFYKQKGGRFGIRAICIICIFVYHKNNKKQIAARQKVYYKANRKYLLKEYCKINKERIKKRQKTYREVNKEHFKKYYEVNKNKRNAYCRKRRKTNIKVKLSSNMSFHIRHSLKNGNGKNGKHWETLVPYTLNDLIKRLKKTLPKGYIWNDYVSGKADLHIDHIIPIAVYNFKSYTDTDFQRCWALKNLQLLPAQDNRIKHAKLTKHFQPSLLL